MSETRIDAREGSTLPHSPRKLAQSGQTEQVDTLDQHGARVQSMFSSIAHGYDRANRIMSLGSDVGWRRRAVAHLNQSAAPAQSAQLDILDLCAGTLDSTREIHRQFPAARITAGDFSAGMLAQGRSLLSEGERQAIDAIEMDAHELPLADDAFDASFCAFGMRNLSDLNRALREQHRILRRGARLVVLDFFRPKALISRGLHHVYNRTVLPLVGWACTGNLDAYRYLPRSIGAFESSEDFEVALVRNGFVVEYTQLMTMGMAGIVVARAEATPELGRKHHQGAVG